MTSTNIWDCLTPSPLCPYWVNHICTKATQPRWLYYCTLSGDPVCERHKCMLPKEPVGTAPPRLNPRRRRMRGRSRLPLFPSLHFWTATLFVSDKLPSSFLASTVPRSPKKVARKAAAAAPPLSESDSDGASDGRTDRWPDLAAFQHICQGGGSDHRSEEVSILQ